MKTSVDRMRFGYSVAFSEEQIRVIDKLTEGDVSFSQIVEDALELYLRERYELVWPHVQRRRRPRLRLEKRTAIYGLFFSWEQDVVLRLLLRDERIRFSALIEDALAYAVPKLFHRAWPSFERVAL